MNRATTALLEEIRRIVTLPPDRELAQNRLSIAHLLLWTLGSAIILGCYRAIVEQMDPTDEASAAYRRVMLVYQLAICPVLGAQVGSLFLVLQRLATGRPYFPAQPGHWLLVIEGVSALLMWAGYGLSRLQVHDTPGFSLFLLLQLPNYLFSLVGYLLAASQNRHQGRLWQAMFAGLALQYGLLLPLAAVMLLFDEAGVGAIPLGFGIYSLLTSAMPALLALGLVVVALLDPHRKVRDYLHWAGVVCQVSMVALQIALQLAFSGLST